MIHIENITINIQPYNTETGPTNTLSEALMKAMADSIFKEQAEEEQEIEEVVKPPINTEHMNSLQQRRADSWMAVCDALDDVSPGWIDAPGRAEDNAVDAIRAMAKAR